MESLCGSEFISVCLPLRINTLIGRQTAASVPGSAPPPSPYTHSCLLMCDGLCCFLINSSHADWSIHLITGCIDSRVSHWDTQTHWTKTGRKEICRETKGTGKRQQYPTDKQSRQVDKTRLEQVDWKTKKLVSYTQEGEDINRYDTRWRQVQTDIVAWLPDMDWPWDKERERERRVWSYVTGC